MAAPALVSIFGAPGEHGYGSHVCDAAAAAKLPSFRCLCAFAGTHSVVVEESAPAEVEGIDGAFRARGGVGVLALGKRFPFEAFSLRWDGAKNEALFVATGRASNGVAGARQTSLLSFAKKRGREESAARASKNHKASDEVVVIV